MDTLKTAKRLQQQGLPQAASEELAEILNEFTTSDPTSRRDLKELENVLQKDLEKVKADLQKEVERTRADLQKEIRSLDVKIEQTKADLQKEIKNTSLNIIKWVAGFLVGQLALFFTLIKLFG
ncbi:MAG: hypothetical protein OXH57_08795 [Ekhidna sp.]|nr:hypothetical protein [Ekhidna sp.]